nr:MAG TPA: hypothetical protein [Caudoviricetes sp.]
MLFIFITNDNFLLKVNPIWTQFGPKMNPK